jgi:hypothetical protein
MPNFPRCIGFGNQEGECAYSATTPGGLYCALCEAARRTLVNAVLAEAEDGRRTLPQPLGQVDAKILECLERVDGAYPIRVANLMGQLNDCELHDMPIGYVELLERLLILKRAGLVEDDPTLARHMPNTNTSVRIAPAARDFLPAPKPREVPDVLAGLQADEIRQSPARVARGTDSPPFVPDGAGDEWEPAA